jgi:hypothetical protein
MEVKTENDSIWTDTAEERVPYWSLILVMYKLGSLTRDEVKEFHNLIILYLNKTNMLLLKNGRSSIYSINLLASQYSFDNSLEVWSSFGHTRRWSLSIVEFFSLHIVQ